MENKYLVNTVSALQATLDLSPLTLKLTPLFITYIQKIIDSKPDQYTHNPKHVRQSP